MPDLTISETIAAGPEAIWPILSDVMHWPDWTPTVSRVEALDRPVLQVGARFKVFQPKLLPAVWTVTSVSPPHGFTWEGRFPGVRMVAGHVLTQHGESSTKLELRFRFAGLLGPLVGRLTRTIATEYMAVEATKLRRRVEDLAAA